ncbi:MAG: outer membrane protein assembly factor BamD [Gemmatimonadetes bacterium]|nr:outer membrane protein assembly factor BamD [Gemmatimonadota bacterium]
MRRVRPAGAPARRGTGRHRAVALVAALALLAACNRGFQTAKFHTSEALFAASLEEFGKRHWENAGKGFERLTLDLPSRDPLLPLAYWYLAQTYDRREEHLIAAQNFQRLAEVFPEDSLADDALFAAGWQYSKMWTTPEVDPQYALLAQSTWRGLLSTYPETALRDTLGKTMLALDDRLARKDYQTGLHYLRRNAYDSAIIYFKDVMKTYPATGHARLSGIRLLESYRAIRYQDEARELCESLRKSYPRDPEVATACALPPPR